MPDTYTCDECGDDWDTLSAAIACEEQDLEDAKTAKINPPRRDPNIIRSVN